MALAPATVFDGVNDYMSASPHTATSNKELTFSFWFKPDALPSGWERLFDYPAASIEHRYSWTSLSNGRPLLAVANPSGTKILQIYRNTATYQSTSTWWHTIFSVDMTDINKTRVYLNGVNDKANWAITPFTNDNLYHANALTWVGAGPGPSNLAGGQYAEVFYHNKYIDLDVAANLALFYNAGDAVDLGPDGSYPFLEQPIVCLNNPFSSFETNNGSGNNYSVTGAFTEGTGPTLVASPNAPSSGGGGILHVPCERVCERSVEVGLHPFSHGYP